MTTANVLSWILLIAPAALGLLVALFASPEVVSAIDKTSEWFERRYAGRAASRRFFLGTVPKWGLWGFHKLHAVTAGVADGRHRAAWRAGSWAYILYAVLLLAYTAFVLVATVVVICLGFWVVSKALESSNSDDSHRRSTRATEARSRKKRDMWGEEFTETRDRDGRVVSTSRTKTDMWGQDYTEERNADGRVVGTSRAKTDVWGDDFVERRDANGAVIGTSRDKTDIWGDDFTEHSDSDGHVVSHSVEKQDIWGEEFVETKSKD